MQMNADEAVLCCVISVYETARSFSFVTTGMLELLLVLPCIRCEHLSIAFLNSFFFILQVEIKKTILKFLHLTPGTADYFCKRRNTKT